MNEGARTNRTGNLMRMLDGDRNRYVALTALPSPEQLSEMLSGCDRLILYFDNPLSIHLFAQGRPAFSKAEQTEKIRRQLDLAVKETGMKLQSRWYYPYPNTAFPVALFSDDHLPSMGECDDNRYHFDRARLELFEEREAVDALKKAHLYPVFAHAYALVLSKLQEELPVYVRFSNERREDAQIRTLLYRDHVEKQAMTGQAIPHITRMAELEEALNTLFDGVMLLDRRLQANHILAAEKETGSMRFALVAGKSLEQQLDEWLAEGKSKEVADCLLSFAEQLRKLPGQSVFEETDSFRTVFGSLPDGLLQLHTLPVTDVDLVCQNILLGDSAQIIDYEWTFTFPVPLEFVIFRFLYFYLEAKNRTCYQQPAFAGLYEKAGITKEMRKSFLQMETGFQQYVQNGALVLRNSYDKEGKPVLAKEKLQEELAALSDIQVSVQYADGSEEKLSVSRDENFIWHLVLKPEKEGEITLRLPFTGMLRLGCSQSFVTNGMHLCGLIYTFDENASATVKIAEPGGQILLSIEEIRLSGAAEKEIKEELADLHFLYENRQQQLEDMKNSASWRLTKPLRRLKGNKED